MTKAVELDEMVTQGPATDIFRAEEALSLFNVISDNAKEVNQSTFAPSFIALQSYAIEQFVLAMTRLFERPSARFQLRSLPAIVDYLLKHAGALPIAQPVIFRKDLKHAGVTIRGLEKMDDKSATEIAMQAIQLTMPTPETDPALNALKALRDKRLGHPEHVAADSIPRTTWEPAEELLDKAKMIVGVLGAYTNSAYVDDDGHYIMSSDSQRASIATRRLLRHIGIGEPLPHEIAD